MSNNGNQIRWDGLIPRIVHLVKNYVNLSGSKVLRMEIWIDPDDVVVRNDNHHTNEIRKVIGQKP